MLALASWTESGTPTPIGRWEGVAIEAAASYLAFAFLMNELFGRTSPAGERAVGGFTRCVAAAFVS
jgi:succinate-acetate transporter protein